MSDSGAHLLRPRGGAMPRRRHRVALCLALLGLTGCGAELDAVDGSAVPAAAPSPTTRMTTVLRFDFEPATVSRGRLATRNLGALPVRTAVVSSAGGQVAVGSLSGDTVLVFPKASAARKGPRAVMSVTRAGSAASTADLSPGGRDFAFGVHFRLDTTSEGVGGDNGNNLVQRGLSGDAAQYKLQVDNGRVSCRVRGDAGDVLVRAQMRILPNQWYTARCARTESGLTLDVDSVRSSRQERATTTGRTGRVGMRATTPVAVGGKVGSDGTIVAGNTDQFNGALDDVLFEVGAGR